MKKVIAMALGLTMSGAVFAGSCKAPDAASIIDTALAVTAASTEAGEGPTFGTLYSLLLPYGLDKELDKNRNYTVFAPTDAAFLELLAGLEEAGISPNPDQLLDVLLYHVVPGSRDGEEVFAKEEMKMLNKQFVTLDAENLMVNTATVVGSAEACNGWVHIVDQVLVPPVFPIETEE